MNEDLKADDSLDITDVVCPITFVKVKMALEELENGQILDVHLNEGEPIQNVPRSLKDEGHKVLSVQKNDDETYNLLVQKGGLEA
ncbi:MAG: sulfurtransferase TusA family protein [Selenomonadales bacterium]|nr:sulfurtransferase TusA family protein [Selenomonadales bacterium]